MAGYPPGDLSVSASGSWIAPFLFTCHTSDNTLAALPTTFSPNVPEYRWSGLLIHRTSLVISSSIDYPWPPTSPLAMPMPHKCHQSISSAGFQRQTFPPSCQEHKLVNSICPSWGHGSLALAFTLLGLHAPGPSLCPFWGRRFLTLALPHSGTGPLV